MVMATADHTHDDMWRTPIPATTTHDEEPTDGATPSRVTDEHAVEDTWYQVLRRKHVEEAEGA
jgi:hypothetical protein